MSDEREEEGGGPDSLPPARARYVYVALFGLGSVWLCILCFAGYSYGIVRAGATGRYFLQVPGGDVTSFTFGEAVVSRRCPLRPSRAGRSADAVLVGCVHSLAVL